MILYYTVGVLKGIMSGSFSLIFDMINRKNFTLVHRAS